MKDEFQLIPDEKLLKEGAEKLRRLADSLRPGEWKTSPEGLFKLHEKLCSQARELMTRKNQDYGSDADAYRNFRMSELLRLKPSQGVLLRMQDKMARIVSFLEKGKLVVSEESWRDCCVDLLNYTVILCGLLEEEAEKAGGSK